VRRRTFICERVVRGGRCGDRFGLRAMGGLFLHMDMMFRKLVWRMYEIPPWSP
jgi:hypothetical protein